MYSFDVFGSLVIDAMDEESFFSFVQVELQKEKYNQLPKYIKNNFASLRKNAELMANKVCKKDGQEVISLTDVYDILGLTMIIEDESLEVVKSVECAMYVQSSVGIDVNIAVAEQLVQQGEQVFFIADTLYDKEVVKKILSKCSPFFSDLECFCSSEFSKSQRTGSLYWKINQIAGVKRADWFYYSTSEEKRLAAGRIGITDRKLQEIAVGEVIDGQKKSDFGLNLMRKIMESTRLECKNTRQELGCTIGAPILLPYVEWMLQCSKELCIDRLFFVARDGYILKKITDCLIMQRNLDIKTYYVHGSRRAWRMPSFSYNSDITELLRWSHVESVKTYGDLADIFDVSTQELKQFVELKENVEPNREISRAALAYCIGKLKHNELFKEYLIEKNKERRELLKEYFSQYIYEGQERMAFVELAGGGYTQESLASVLQELGITQMVNFYFKLDSNGKSENCHYYVFWPNAMKNSAIIETLCHSVEGQTYGYKRKNGRVLPVMAEKEGQALENYGYGEYVSGILMFVEKYMKYIDGFLTQLNCIEMVSEYMRVVGEEPGNILSSFIAQMPFGVTGRENEIKEYAESLEVKSGYDTHCFGGDVIYPLEFVEEGAVIVVVDFFGEKVYEFIKCQKKEVQLLKADKLFQEREMFKLDCQYVLGIENLQVMHTVEEQLIHAGVPRERILGIDINPKYIIGK